MKFTQRLKYYLIGFGLGLFLVFLLFKDRTWSWLPENRVLDFIVDHPILVNKNAYSSLVDSIDLGKEIFNIVLNGSVDFSKSNTSGEIKLYHLHHNQTSIEIALSFSDSVSRIVKINQIDIPYTKNLNKNSSTIHMDNENFINLINDITFSYNNIFNCHLRNWGFENNIIKDNIASLDVLWNESLPYKYPNPWYVSFIKLDNKKYLIHFEKGDQRIRFKNIISTDLLKENIPLIHQFSKADCVQINE